METRSKSAVSKAARTTGNRFASEVFVKKNRSTYNESAWVVFSTPEGIEGKRKSPRLFSSTLTRDEVRSAYSKEMGINKDDTRSRRVSNY